jgi:hypothetical protein
VNQPLEHNGAPRSPSHEERIGRLPKVWIGYLLSFATLIGEMVAVARHPEMAKSGEIQALPLEIYLPAFVAVVYWLVCVHRFHSVLANVPGWKHPVTPGKAVGFHFIPIYFFYWIFRWPSAIAEFVNHRLHGKVMNRWTVGVCFLASMVCRLVLDPAISVAILFFGCSYVSGFLHRALAAPDQVEI